MFGRKKKDEAPKRARVQETPQRIRIDGPAGAMYDGTLTLIKIPESLIIELSIEFFDDPEPCHIHRGAVLKRVYMEINMLLGNNSVTPVADLPESVLRYLKAYEGITSVTMYREEDAQV